MLVAGIIVNNPSKSVDREFDYLIPTELASLVKPGIRVIVPFGQGNKTLEGFVIHVHDLNAAGDTDTASNIKYKYIIDICDSLISLDEKLIEIAYFLKETYHCTLIEGIRLMLPSGTTLLENIQIKRLKNDISPIENKYKEIMQNLSYEKYTDYRHLNESIVRKLKRSELFELERLGIVEIKREMEQNVGVKKEIVYVLSDIAACEQFVLNYPQRLKKQAEVLKHILEDNEPLTANEMYEKYNCSSGIIKALTDKGLLAKSYREIFRDPFKQIYNFNRVELTEDQTRAINNILTNFASGKNISLLFGVTGCGKTEIYMQLIEDFIGKDYGSIIMVPEISLTPQTVERFKGRFGDVVAVLHSKLSEGEKFDQWCRIKKGEIKVVVGARSAVFAPVKNLKIIVLDEEHEYSYKSESAPRYLAHEVAKFRMNQNGGLLVLGSATPSLESYYRAEIGLYNLVEIDKRIENIPLPEVKLIDLREELRNGNKSMFSKELYDGINQNLIDENQTILFLNRRGHSTFVSCRACGYKIKCNHCDVTMTYHAGGDKLVCHYCNSQMYAPKLCPVCGSKYIKHFGVGTEKIEEETKKSFPTARVLRMDMDTTRKKGEHERIYSEFKSKQGDILIGTQMISKGMDFKDVTLVGVIAADTSLNLPDFRAAERTFQLILQVAGRAGRSIKRGKVIVQTYDPENYSIQFASKHDYKGFYKHEIEYRKMLMNPPFSDILYVLMVSEKDIELKACSNNISGKLRMYSEMKDFEILGPAPCHISKIKNNFRYHLMFKGSVKKWYNEINNILSEETNKFNVKYYMDINPYNMI